MAGQIPSDFVKSLADRVDLPAFLGTHIPVKKLGSHFKACCPFHHEKTPSFVIYDSHYHCFGCGAHGDAIGFLREHLGLDFVSAIEQVATFVGVSVPRTETIPKEERVKFAKQLSTLESVSDYYQKRLWDEEKGRDGRAYLRQRGLSASTVKYFKIGVSLPGWSHLSHFFSEREQDLKDAGLVIEGKKGVYDRFRNRLMFPIRNYKGGVVGFGGRVLDNEKPKYLNSPETDTFKKGELLYGLYEYLQLSQKPEQIFVVEGYMDVIGLYQYGVQGAMATLGTAFTEVHWHTLKKYRQPIVFCFDGDEAGLKAAWRSLQVILPLLKAEDDIRFLFLPKGEDPDSFVARNGQHAFLSKADAAMTPSELILNDVQPGNAEYRARQLKQKSVLINKVRDNALKGMWVDATAKAFQVSSGFVWRALKDADEKITVDVSISFEEKTEKNLSTPIELRMLKLLNEKTHLVQDGKIKVHSNTPLSVQKTFHDLTSGIDVDFYALYRKIGAHKTPHHMEQDSISLSDEEALSEWENLSFKWVKVTAEERLNQLKSKAKISALTADEKQELSQLLLGRFR